MFRIVHFTIDVEGMEKARDIHNALTADMRRRFSGNPVYSAGTVTYFSMILLN
jgi:hypothetical protein